MDELAKELASARAAVVPAWSDARAERLLVGVAQLRRKRRAQRVSAAGLASLAAVGLLYFGGSVIGGSAKRASLRSVPVAQSPAARPAIAEPGLHPPLLDAKPHAGAAEFPEETLAALPLKLADGSHVKALSGGAAVSVEQNQPKHIQLRLDAGGARFDVIPNTHRQFTVRAGSVEVAVLGTVFDVERRGGRVRVSVSRGKVRVRTGSSRARQRTAIVKVGESRWFEDIAADERTEPNRHGVSTSAHARTPRVNTPQSAAKSATARSTRHTAGATRERAHESPPRAAWRSLSQSGDYEGAYQLLQHSTVEDDDSGALLDAADAARLSGHPQAAVAYLRKVLAQHRDNPVAPLAAFTLGRVLLERLGQPSEAADAFATARRLAPNGSLAQDALAREVEAWSKAGRPDDAYRLARQYVDTYPNGRRLRAVQLYGGL